MDKILKEAYDKLKAIEEATSPEEEQINVLTLRMRRATEDDDEAAYKRAVNQLNALTDKMNAEQQVEEDDDYVPMSREERDREREMQDARNRSGSEDSHAIGYPEEFEADSIDEGTDPEVLHDAAIDMLDDMLDALPEEDRYGPKGDVIRYALKRLQETGLGR